MATTLEYELIHLLAAAEDPRGLDKELLARIVNAACEEVGAIAAAIFVRDRDTERTDRAHVTLRAATKLFGEKINKLSYRTRPGASSKDRHATGPLGLAGWVVSKGRIFVSQGPEETRDHPEFIGDGLGPQLAGACAILPIRNPRGHAIGALRVDLGEGKHYDTERLLPLERFAAVAGRCIAHYEDALSRSRRDAIFEWAYGVISESVAAEVDLDAFLDVVVRVVSAATRADSCAVFLIDQSKKTLTQRAGSGSQELRKRIRSYELPNAERLSETEKRVGLTPFIAVTGESHYARNQAELNQHPHHVGQFQTENFEPGMECGAWYGVPLETTGEITGVLKIENITKMGTEDGREISLIVRDWVDSLAHIIALSIERVNNHLTDRFETIDAAVGQILRASEVTSSLEELVTNFVRGTKDLFNARACALFLRVGDRLIQPPWAAEGWLKNGPTVREYALIPPEEIPERPATPEDRVGLTAWIASMQTKFVAKSNLELTAHPHHKGTYDSDNFDSAQNESCETFMGIPLLAGKELVGVLKVETKIKDVGGRPGFAYFTERDERVLELIAHSAAVAIRNALIVESRLLADRILGCSNANSVFEKLHHYMEGRIGMIDTLDQTRILVEAQNNERAKIIHNTRIVIGDQALLLEALDELSRSLEAPLAQVPALYAAALRATDLRSVTDFVQAGTPLTLLENDQGPLIAGLVQFRDSCQSLAPALARFRDDPLRREELEIAVSTLDRVTAVAKGTTMNPFDGSVLAAVYARWHSILMQEREGFHTIENRYHAGTGLQPASPLFVGREDVFRWISNRLRSSEAKLMVLHGGGRSGKTSILNQLLSDQSALVTPHPVYPVKIDFMQMDFGTEGVLLESIAERLAAKLTAQGVPITLRSRLLFDRRPRAAFSSFLDDLVGAHAGPEKARFLVMLDEFGRLDRAVKEGTLPADFFEFLRGVFQDWPALAFLIAGKEPFAMLTREFCNLIGAIAEPRLVGFLNRPDAETLIRQPVAACGVRFDSTVVDRIIAVTNGHPYFIQQLCSGCITELNSTFHNYDVSEACLNRALELAFSAGNTVVLEEQWDHAAHDQPVLRCLADLVSEDSPSVSRESLAEALDAVNSDRLSDSLVRLEAHQLIERVDDKVRFATDMLRRFVSGSWAEIGLYSRD